MQFETDKLPQQINSGKLGGFMREVLYALIPGTLLMIWFFGWGTVFNLFLSIGFALLLEAFMLQLRQRPVKPFLADNTAVITAWLLALTMPAFAPWWLLLVAIFFSIVVAKHLYGGLGYNPFNPAMVGYAVALISFPVDMVQWFEPVNFSMAKTGFFESLQIVFGGLTSIPDWDALTMATPLDEIQVGLRMEKPMEVIQQHSTFGLLAGNHWEWINIAWLLGGLWLIYRKIITWHIPAAMLATMAVIATIMWFYNPQAYAGPVFHLLAGGTMLGAFFIATDPVTASTTPLGKLFFAASIGFFAYVIRVWGSGYPDGVAFAVLIMNMAVPLIDYYTRPRVFGAGGLSE